MQLRMKVVRGKPKGHFLIFPQGKFMFGRGPECDVRPNSDLISRQHCLLQITDEYITIRDLGSANGTLVNGDLVIGDIQLTHGDTLQLGPLVLQVDLETQPDIGNPTISDTAMGQTEETRRNYPTLDS
jgi:pSer/pThr/pTyr-binding forkhead associated (FHA) protein